METKSAESDMTYVVEDDNSMGSLKKFFLAFICAGIFILAGLCSKKSGDEVIVNRDCFGASSKSAFEQMVHAAVTGDRIEIMDMMYSGQVRNINAGTKGKVLEDGGTCFRVKLYDDNSSWWVSSDHVD